MTKCPGRPTTNAGTAVERELQKLGVGVAKPSQVHWNRVSVLTPTTAARAAFHAQLWQCFSAQTWPNKELVVVETYDSTVEQPSSFFQDLKDDRLVHVALAHDLNVGLKRNISVLMASGEYCVNFDDDDFYADGYVERMVGELQLRGLGALKLSAWHNYFESTGRCGYSTPHTWKEDEERDNNVFGYGFSYVYRRELALAYPYPHLDFGEDAPFMLKLRDGCRVGLMEDLEGVCLHLVHRHSSTMDPEVSRILPQEELEDLEVADSQAFQHFISSRRSWWCCDV
ncbi:unnamed protein product [Durusdinium trenchii]|uniref:Glycosyltransferase 2-like domain-containing protein n=1 Tax=Durusdinium trenchii TaxID=1381693 RepID=A0ABP0RJT8_9DINO